MEIIICRRVLQEVRNEINVPSNERTIFGGIEIWLLFILNIKNCYLCLYKFMIT